jgi:RNA polymerase sigma factor (sigma-70 family)
MYMGIYRELTRVATAEASPCPSDSDPIMNAKTQDRVLAVRAQSGEHSAYNDLVCKYQHDVLKLSMRYMRNRADAEDAVQETFMKAYWGLQHFRGDAAFSSWLYYIALNSAKTALLLRGRHSKVFAPAPRKPDDLSENSTQLKGMASPEVLASTEEVCDAVNGAIEALAEEQRTAIVLRDFQGLMYRQVASAMSWPRGYRALARISGARGDRRSIAPGL